MHPEKSPAHGDNCLRVTVDVSTVHTDVCCFFLLCGRQPATKTRRNGPLSQSLYVNVLVLSLHLQSMDSCFKHPQLQPSRHYKHDSLQPHMCLSKRGGMQKTDHSIAEIGGVKATHMGWANGGEEAHIDKADGRRAGANG